MSYSRRAALQSLAMVAEALREGVSFEDRHHLARAQRLAIAALQVAAHRPETLRLAERVRQLDAELERSGMPQRERSATIRERLGLSRSRLHRLQKVSRFQAKRSAGVVRP